MSNELHDDIRELLESGDWRVQREAMLTVSRDPDAYNQAFPAFFAVCVNPPSILGSFSWNCFCKCGIEPLPLLLDKLTSGSPIERRVAIQLLLNLGHDPSSCTLSEQVLQARPHSLPKWGAYKNKVVVRLNEMLYDSDTDVSATAAWALDEVGESSSPIVNCLIRGLQSANRSVIAYSALSLGRLGAPDALPALEEFLQSEPREHEVGQSVRPRLAAAQAIIKTRNTEP